MNFKFKYEEFLEGILQDNELEFFANPPNEVLDNILLSRMSVPVSALTCEGESKIFIDLQLFANTLTPEDNKHIEQNTRIFQL